VTQTSTELTPSSRTLRERRLAAGLTIRELAYFARCSKATIQRLENGTLDVSPAIKARIARALRCPVQELWEPEGDE